MIFIVFALGLSIGSFINALVYRLEEKKKIVIARSECPKCLHQLNYLDLIPLVSFIFLKGRCRYCKTPVSWQYPAVEALTGIAFLLPFFAASPFGLSYLKYFFFASVLMVIFAYDLRYMLIPDAVSISAIILVFLIQLIDKASFASILNILLAGAAASGFFLIQYIISKGRWIGGGDIRLGFLMGLMVGWPNIILALFLSYIGGSLITLPLVAVRKFSMKSHVPFGVFLTVSTIAVLVWGEAFVEWYARVVM